MALKKYRLLGQAQIAGGLREPGFIFEMEEWQIGPCRGTIAGDVKLYELVEDEPVQGEVSAEPVHLLLERLPALSILSAIENEAEADNISGEN
jgi:hypothetical protein